MSDQTPASQPSLPAPEVNTATPTPPSTIDRSGGVDLQGDSIITRGDVVGRDKITHYYAARAERRIPRQALAPDRNYVPRLDEEQALRHALLSENARPITVLYGLSGTGKTSLAARVIHGPPDDAEIRGVSETEFTDGDLWGDLAGRDVGEVLSQMASALYPEGQHGGTSDQRSARDEFWRMLDGKRTLIVLDNLQTARQLEEFLPADLGRNRVLCICALPLAGFRIPLNEQKLGPFKPAEALDLFGKILDQETVESYRSTLTQIAERVEYRPQKVAQAAARIRNERLYPEKYLRELVDDVGDELNLALSDLTPEQVEIAEAVGFLGDNDWHSAMLAAVTLRSMSLVRQTVDQLVRNLLIIDLGNGRYRMGSSLREAAEKRIAQRPLFAQQAAYHLLARYCLDLAQDLEAQLRQQYGRLTIHPAAISPEEESARELESVIAFRKAFLTEMPHVKKVLNWAMQTENWNLIRRFSYVPHMSLINEMVARRTTSIQSTLTLGVARSLVITPRGTAQGVYLWDLIADGDFRVGEWKVRADDLCDLAINSMACRIYDAILEDVNFVEASWVGVRAAEIVFNHCDLVGTRFLACDFSRSVWMACDARRTNLNGTSLRLALLREVNLRGASLRGVDFTGAVLDHVDLRGADLTGANLSGAQFIEVNLADCCLDHTQWAEAQYRQLIINRSTSLQLGEIESLIRQTSDQVIERPYAWQPDDREHLLRHPVTVGFDRADLRGVELTGAQLTAKQFSHADLRCANLKDAELSEAKLEYATLRSANLAGARLTAVGAFHSDWRAANLQNADLQNARLAQSDFFAAFLSNAHLQQADLRDADLRYADLAGANLENAILSGAQLAMANLSGAKLQGAQVSDEQLAQAGELGGAVLPSGHVAIVVSGNIKGVEGSGPWKFAMLSGNISQVVLPGNDLFGARFNGNFREVDLSFANLTCANLRGSYDMLNLSGANLSKALLDGTFHELNLALANLNGATLRGEFNALNLSGANLVNAKLEGNFVIDRMRGAITGPDGTRYDGRLSCPGDLEDARAAGIDVNDAAAMARFYAQADQIISNESAQPDG